MFDFDKDGPFLIRGIAIGTGVAGFAVFARSIRLFTTFHHARHIPDEFIRKQIRLRGAVTSVSDNGLLELKHRPIMRIPFSKFFVKSKQDSDNLAIRIAGVDVTPEGCQWLKRQLTGKPISLYPVRREDHDVISCDVYMKKGRFFNSNINRELVRMGNGRVLALDAPGHLATLQVEPVYARLVHDLLICERYADRRGVGYWRRPSALRRFTETLFSWRYAAGQFQSRSLLADFLRAVSNFGARAAAFSWPLAKLAGAKTVDAAKRLKDVGRQAV